MNLVCMFSRFLGPKNSECIKIDSAVDAHAKSETTISLLDGSLQLVFIRSLCQGEYSSLCETAVQKQNGQAAQVILHSKMQAQGDPSCRKRREQTCCMGIFSARE